MTDEEGKIATKFFIEVISLITQIFHHGHVWLPVCSVLTVCVCVCVSLVEDEESTIEEQEAMEVEADQKAELEELTKDGK